MGPVVGHMGPAVSISCMGVMSSPRGRPVWMGLAQTANARSANMRMEARHIASGCHDRRMEKMYTSQHALQCFLN
jgi:hypothetical protein